MNKEKFNSELLKNKPKGVRYLYENETTIREALKNSSIRSLYMTLKNTDAPPPILLNTFQKHIKKLGWDYKKPKEQEKKQSKLDNLSSSSGENKTFHDSSVDPENLM